MEEKLFKDEMGREWKVIKVSACRFKIEGPKEKGDTNIKIAKSCAKNMGMDKLPSGEPVEEVKNPDKIWNALWKRT